MGKLQVVPAAPARTPERERYAEVFASLRETQAEPEKIQQANLRYFCEVYLPAEAALRAAKENVGVLHASEAAAVVEDLISNGTSDRANALRTAEKTLDDAQAALDKANAVYEAFSARIAEAKKAAELAGTNFPFAFNRALRNDPAILALMDRFLKVRCEFLSLLQVVELTQSWHDYRHYYGFPNPKDFDTTERDKWRAAIEKLRTDPDAEMPKAP